MIPAVCSTLAFVFWRRVTHRMPFASIRQQAASGQGRRFDHLYTEINTVYFLLSPQKEKSKHDCE